MGFAERVASTQMRRELAAEYLIRIGCKIKLENYASHVMPHYDHNIPRPGPMDACHLPGLTKQCSVWSQRCPIHQTLEGDPCQPRSHHASSDTVTPQAI